MPELAHSLVGRYGYEGHRKIEVKKHENGYEVAAQFSKVAPVHADAAAYDNGHRVFIKTFVFYTVPEVLDFVREYLNVPTDSIRSE